MTADLRVGDTRTLIREVPDGSVSLVATSPPFLALRSYLPADHADKSLEIGSEPDPASFLATLLELAAGWSRVLSPFGSIAIELGDTFAGSSARGSDQDGTDRYKSGRGQSALDHKKSAGEWPRPKSLALIPQLFAASLAYGRNLLTGEPCDQWLVRNMIVWHRPNPAVGALGDKFRPATSYIVVATRSKARWFDLSAVRIPLREPGANGIPRLGTKYDHHDGRRSTMGDYFAAMSAGAPPQDCWFDQHETWSVTSQPSRLAHYAMWPPKLAERLILSMCPEWVCATCGQPRRRIEESVGHGVRVHAVAVGRSDRNDWNAERPTTTTTTTTTGWSDCGHDNYTAGTVLDPFAGTGTTLAVADLHRRDGIGFELNAHSASLYDARRAEVARSLFGTTPEIPGQQDLFDGAA